MSQKELNQRLNLENLFVEISQYLNSNKNSFLTWNILSKEKEISKYESMYILTNYVSQLESYHDYAILFELELEDKDNYTKILVSNLAENFAEKITDNSVISAHVHSISLIDEKFNFLDYSSFVPESELIKRFDYQLVRRERKIPEENEELMPIPKKEEPKPVSKKDGPMQKSKLTKNEGKSKKTGSRISSKNASKKGSRKNSSSSGDEEYFQGFKPKNKNENDSLKMKKDVIIEEEGENESKKKSGIPINIDKKEYQNEDNSFDKDMDEKEEKATKKVLKKRKVKKTKTYVTEKGYMVTQDEYVEEEYWTDEVAEPAKKEVSKPSKQIEPAPKAKKKLPQGQCGIESFFKK